MNTIKSVAFLGSAAVTVVSVWCLSRPSQQRVAAAERASFSEAGFKASEPEDLSLASPPRSLDAPPAYGDEISAEEVGVQEKRLAGRQQFAAQMFAHFQREPVDSDWAPDFERGLYQAAQVDPARVDVMCKTTLCRVTLTANSGLSETPGVLDFIAKQGARIKVPGPRAPDASEFELYVVRNGTASPSEDDDEQ